MKTNLQFTNFSPLQYNAVHLHNYRKLRDRKFFGDDIFV